MIKLINDDNMNFETPHKANLIYADMIYENHDFSWVYKYWEMLARNGIFQVQTDYHTAAEIKLFLDSLPESNFVNEIIYKQEWGGIPKKGFPMKHDNIFIYSKGLDFHWNPSKIRIPKKTAGTKFDKKGTGLKTPCSVFDDLGNFSTMSKERIKNSNGKNIRWQKPEKLLKRLMLPFLKKGDLVIDPFMGSGTAGAVCGKNGWNYIGIESGEEEFSIALERLTPYLNDTPYVRFRT